MLKDQTNFMKMLKQFKKECECIVGNQYAKEKGLTKEELVAFISRYLVEENDNIGTPQKQRLRLVKNDSGIH